MKNLILAIESSCDDSSIAIINKDDFSCEFEKKISQEAQHCEFGGVVPELAARLHTNALPEILRQCKPFFDRLCAVAVTSEPGLSVSLISGITMAKSLAGFLKLPLIAVNHLLGHIYSLFLDQKAFFDMGILLVSGGHTMVLYIDEKGEISILAKSLDDSFGESFDKVAKMLGFGYPGGAIIENLASKATQSNLHFSVPLLHSKECNFSFSGLKNAVRVQIQSLLQDKSSQELCQDEKQNIAYAFEKTAIAHLCDKTKKLFEKHKFKHFGIVGGASANLKLREAVQKMCEEFDCKLQLAPLSHCADNALMIARAACALYERAEFVFIDEDILQTQNTRLARM